MNTVEVDEEQSAFNELHDYYCNGRQHEFITDILGADLWKTQVEIVRAIFEHSKVAVKTCNAVGKSYVAARIAIAYLMLYPDSIVVTTAPTWNQVVNVLWREIRSAVKHAEKVKGIKLTDNEVNQAGLNIAEKWYAIGVSTSTPDNMMGFHADHLLVIVDEAGGVDDLMFNGVRAITTGIDNKVLLIGNPTTPDGEFHRAFGDSSMYKQITVSAFDTPNLKSLGFNTVEDLRRHFDPPPDMNREEQLKRFEWLRQEMKPKLPYRGLIEPSDVYEKLKNWGADSNAWQALVMGEFPNQAEQSLIPANLVAMAMNMYGIDEETKKTYAELSGWEIPSGPPAYGQDMARFGGDLNVLTPRRGGWCEDQVVWNKKGEGKLDLMESADQIINLIDPLNDELILAIDDTGNGGGTTDRLRQKSRESLANNMPAHRYKLIDFNFGRGPNNPDKFHDITSEIYWNLRTWFYNKAIALPYNEQLKNELIGRRWTITPQKKIKVESKEEYKKRTGGRSPDRSDSLALAFVPLAGSSWTQGANKQDYVKATEADPQRTGVSAGGFTGGMMGTRF